MKRSACVAWTFLALLFVDYACAKEKLNKSTFQYAGHSRTYYSFVPDDPLPLPVIVLLHGSGRSGQELADPWKSLAASEHFIIAAPNSLDPATWDSDNDSPAFLHEVVNQIKAAHPIDENRIYLFGHSGGAVYALALALIDSEYYAATAVHAGALRPQKHDLFAYAKRIMPVAIWVGDHDAFFPLETVKNTKAQFDSNGFDLKLVIVPNHTHNYEDVAGEVNQKAWEFLRTAKIARP